MVGLAALAAFLPCPTLAKAEEVGEVGEVGWLLLADQSSRVIFLQRIHICIWNLWVLVFHVESLIGTELDVCTMSQVSTKLLPLSSLAL